MSDIRDVYARDEAREAAFRGTLARRMFAFIIDYTIVGFLILIAVILVFFLGILTFGLGWSIYPVLGFLVGIVYFGATVGGSAQASLGMRMMGLMLVQQNGRPLDFMTAVVHLVLFWLFNTVLTPFVLLIGLFTNRNRLLHDVLLGTAVADRGTYRGSF